MRSFPFLLFLALSWSLSSAAWGGDCIVSRAVLEDRAGTLSIAEAAQAKFLPADAILSKGYTDSAHWLRIVVRPCADGGELVLRIRPAFLDEIKLYEPEPAVPGGWKTRVTGDRTPYLARERASVVLGFTIKPVKPESVYYLRLKTTSSSILNVEALEPHQAQIKDMRLGMYQTGYLGFMLSLLVWAINNYAYSRQRVVAWFILHQFAHLCHNFALMGWLAPLLESDHLGLADKLTSIIVWANALVATIFHRTLFTPFAPLRLAMRGFDAMILVILGALAIMAFGHTRLALHITALMITLCIPMAAVLAFSARQEAAPGRRILRTIYSLLAVSLFILHLPMLGWSKAIEWNLHSMSVNGLITACLMFALLHLRSRQLLRDGEQAVLELALIGQQLDMERAQREEQNRFMSMLNHELKMPLSVIRMTLGMKEVSATVKKHAQQSVQDVDAVIERCLQADRLEQQQLAPVRQSCRVDKMLGELCTASATPQRLVMQFEALPAVDTDPQLLRIALGNLIDNALKYAEPQSAVYINVSLFEHQGRQGILNSIANASGTAVMPDPQRVFDKYYRGPGAQGKTGSGLGLYLVRSVTELLDGWIRYCPFENEVRFELWIPC
ncbi:MAG TPA: 7TM-DISM domain-containing protein [Methylobacter sp.]|jgi:signal transduction histidine kinase